MTQVRQDRSAMRVGVLMAVAMALSAESAPGQSISNQKHTSRGPVTVSVATLQVSQQAWKHLEKARRFAAEHEAVESERECEKALSIAPAFPEARLLEASQQLSVRDFAGAIKNVVAARKTDPEAEWAGVILAGAYNGLHRFDEALTEIQSLQEPEAASWQAKYEGARAATGLGDEEQALKLSSELLSIAPKNFADAALVRTNALMLAHRWGEAASNLNAYLALPGEQLHREQARKALAEVTRLLHAEGNVNLASR